MRTPWRKVKHACYMTEYEGKFRGIMFLDQRWWESDSSFDFRVDRQLLALIDQDDVVAVRLGILHDKNDEFTPHFTWEAPGGNK